MYAYDCVIAIDPQWTALKPDQIELFENWVGEQGGGMIAIPGPVCAGVGVGGWLQEASTAKIRALYPIEFHRRFSLTEGEATGGVQLPVAFTREGREAEFLWLADSDAANQAAWTEFKGVFQCFPVRGPKPGAAVYARLADSANEAGALPRVFMAGQFYGSGRVFYLGSAEMWRLRRVGDRCFEQFYTRLIRHVSQGRLLRQSSRGALMAGKDRYLLGNAVDVRAQLSNAQLHPLSAPSVLLEVIAPDRSVQTVSLRADASRPGMYAGQFTVLQEGMYRLELPIPESDNERLSRQIQVRLPDLERENPQRNEPLLIRLAQETGGKYYDRLSAAWSPDAEQPITAQLKARPKVVTLTSAMNPQWEETWLRWGMLAICGLLCLEWIIRRFVRLA
jgi:hypothetical protein